VALPHLRIRTVYARKRLHFPPARRTVPLVPDTESPPHVVGNPQAELDRSRHAMASAPGCAIHRPLPQRVLVRALILSSRAGNVARRLTAFESMAGRGKPATGSSWNQTLAAYRLVHVEDLLRSRSSRGRPTWRPRPWRASQPDQVALDPGELVMSTGSSGRSGTSIPAPSRCQTWTGCWRARQVVNRSVSGSLL